MRILLFGDIPGIPQLLRHLPPEHVVGIVGAVIRPQYHAELERLAVELGVPFIIQPQCQSPDYSVFKERIAALSPDLIWVNSYSMIIRDDILAIPRLGGVNIHAALLPRNRGCNPTQWAILNGDHETGVTLHEMTSGLDEGPIIDQRAVPLMFEDTWTDVRDRLTAATENLIKDNLSSILSGKWVAIPQAKQDATIGRRRIPADGAFDWTESVVDIYNKIRALLPPLPPAFCLDTDAQQQEMTRYQTIWEVTALKYTPALGGGQMHSERVRLRPLLKSDAPLLYEWITVRDLVILNSPLYPVSESDHEAWIEKMMTRQADLVIFVIEDIDSGQAIGTCQLIKINWHHRNAELQIRIGVPAFHGKGYGSEAVRLLTVFGFKDLNLHRIYLHVFADNVRAVRAYEKCGFEREGTLREAAHIDGKWVDIAVMGLLRIP